jgi:3-phenylpropionate/trans-cinnamate dioxygenase ferredoxin subunit
MTQDTGNGPFHRVGPADFGPGEFRDYQVEGRSVLIANCDGTFCAIDDRCTHDNGPLTSGRLYRCEIECPRHGGKFDVITGKATALPAFNAVASHLVRVVDGQLEIRLSPPPTRRYEDPRELGGFRFA